MNSIETKIHTGPYSACISPGIFRSPLSLEILTPDYSLY